MPVELPFEPTIPFQTFGTTLDGTQYVINVRWNDRAQAWFFDLLTEGEEMIRAGIRIVLGTVLGGRSADDRMPAGMLKAVDLTETGTEATLDDLGVRVVVYFFTLEELAAL